MARKRRPQKSFSIGNYDSAESCGPQPRAAEARYPLARSVLRRLRPQKQPFGENTSS